LNAATAQRQLERAIQDHQNGDLAAATNAYAAILRQYPGTADAWHLSGLIAYQQRAYDDAERLIRQALEVQPGQPDYLSNLAAVLLAVGRNDEAESAARAAIAGNPNAGKCHKHLATALSRRGQFEEAIAILERIVAEDPLDATAHCNLGAILQESKRPEQATGILELAIELAPQSFEARLNLGAALRETGQLRRSLIELGTAVTLGPNVPQCYINRGNTRLDLGDTPGALADFQRAIELDPRSAVALNGLGRTLQSINQWAPALDALGLACQLDGPLSRFESNRLYCASLADHLSREQLYSLHETWGRCIEEQTDVLPNKQYQHDRLRIGYVSPDFHNHATMRFILPLLKAHDRQRFDVYCYAEGRHDSVSDRIRNICTGWRSTTSLSDSALTEQIRKDEIDVLVDLAGHTAGNRLPVFATHPATVQASFLGYPNTTGLKRIDYFLTDAIRETPETAAFFTEELIHLPHGACCFEAPSEIPITDPPSRTHGQMTFGSTHRMEKLSHECLQLWARVLRAVPDSRLLMIRDSLVHTTTQEIIRDRLREAGVDISRVEFAGKIPNDHLQIYHNIDILLDVFPWGSGTTAYECMWMGVPIPTIAGDRGSCRATASLMHQLGLNELTARNADECVEIITSLAANPTRLRELRHQIRPAMKATVCNVSRFATDMEELLTWCWKSKTNRPDATPREVA
jgi:protein O-GlcNAc transferase